MPRIMKVLLGLTGVLMVAVVGAGVALRSTRASVGTPTELRASLLTIPNGHVSMGAARVKDGVVLFDAGQDPAGHALLALLEALHAKPEDVHDVFLTHAHSDHLAGVPLLPNARIWAGAADVDLAAGNVEPEARVGRFFNMLFQPPHVRVSNALKGIVDIPVGGISDVRCFPMPGHTPGSYAFLYDRVLFVGDTMTFANGALAPPFAVFDVQPALNRASIHSLRAALESTQVDRICTAHGGCTPDGEGLAMLDTFIATLPKDT